MIGKKSGHNILVVSDTAKEVADIKYLLSAHFEHVRFSIDEEEVLEHLGQLLPDVLILAFTRIEQAEQFYLRLYRSKSVMSGHFHQTILLCTSRESRKAFQLCRTGIFDEYVVDRPLYDPQRITLSIEQAMSRLSIQRQVASLQEKLRKSKQGVSPFETTMFERISVCNNQHQNMKELVDHIASDLGIQGGQLKDKVEGACQTLGEIHSEFAHHIETSSLNGQMKTIMLVDDDEFYREQIIGILAQEGYQILEADNGAAALNLLQINQPDLILLDYKMPEMDGLSALKQIKQNPELNNIPVIMLTGYSQGGLVKQSMQAGVAGYIVKPGDRATLINRIEEALSPGDGN